MPGTSDRSLVRHSKSVRKYLERYAEREIRLAEELDREFRNVLVVPALAETHDLIEGIEPVASERDLVILVVNASEDASPDIREQNDRLISAVLDRAASVLGLGRFNRSFLAKVSAMEVLVLDRTSPARALPRRQGVGLARKIGCDIALALWARGRLESPWIHTSDADAIQPPDRFEAAARMLLRHPEAVALTFPFRHVGGADVSVNEAVRFYETSLRYYVEGLRWARSPYGFHTVGSTIAARADAYASARGFPKREGGEDFYLLNKLAKMGEIVEPDGGVVRIRSRRSARVPFGTGPAVRSILQRSKRGEPWRLYDPRCFGLLRSWLGVLREFSTSGGRLDSLLAGSLASLPSAESEVLTKLLERLGAVCALESVRARQSASRNVLRSLDTWFDGFRTLKFIHGARDLAFPNLEWRRALREAPFARGRQGHAHRTDAGEPGP